MKQDDSLRLSFTSADLNDLAALLAKANAIDGEKLFIGGFPNHVKRHNALFANLFTGKKNLRFLSKHGDTFYMLKFNKNELVSYFSFNKEHVRRVKVKKKLLTTAFRVELNDKSAYSVDVTVNKDLVKTLQTALK